MLTTFKQNIFIDSLGISHHRPLSDLLPSPSTPPTLVTPQRKVKIKIRKIKIKKGLICVVSIAQWSVVNTQ